MENTISINSNEMSVKEYNGQRVVTFKDIDKVHGRLDGTAHRNFKANRKRFIESIDYFKLQRDEIRPFGVTSPNGGIILTESGYLMLAKSFTDDLAWTVQRELVNNYFRIKEQPKEVTEHEQFSLNTKEYFYAPKKWNGMSVITLVDFNHFTGVLADTARHILYSSCEKGKDYFVLKEDDLRKFKVENSLTARGAKGLVLITQLGVQKLLTYYNSNAKIPFEITGNERPQPKLPKPLMELPQPKTINADDCITALGVLGEVRKYIKEPNDLKAINTTIQYTAWQLGIEVHVK